MKTSNLSALFACSCLAVSLAGCPASDDAEAETSPTTSATEDGTTTSDEHSDTSGSGAEGGDGGPPQVLDLGDDAPPPDDECGPDFSFVSWDGDASQLLDDVGAATSFVGVGDCTVAMEGEAGEEPWTSLDLACLMDGARDDDMAFTQEQVEFSLMLRRPEGDMPLTEELLGPEVLAKVVVTPASDRISADNVWVVLEGAPSGGTAPTVVITAADAVAPDAKLYTSYVESTDWHPGFSVETGDSSCLESDSCTTQRSMQIVVPGLQPVTAHPLVGAVLEGVGEDWDYALYPAVATEPTGDKGCMIQVADLRFVVLPQPELVLK